MRLLPGAHLGPYEIRSFLGSGGMGEVYRAHDARLGRDVAIKVLPESASSDPERLKRFEREARAAAALNHPSILAVHDVGTHEGSPYIVAELLEGESLRERLQSGGLSVQKALEVAVPLARALSAAHDKGIVHRDLKPENVFLTADGHVKVLDFGLAKLRQRPGEIGSLSPTATKSTASGIVMGTAAYMSPEQVRGQETDARSDVFSFGVVLYEMLSGQRPFRGESAADVMAAVLQQDPPSLLDLDVTISPLLERVTERCLEKRPEDRFHSAHDLAIALDAISGAASAGRPAFSGATSRLIRRLRRRRWVSAAVVVALAAAGGWGAWRLRFTGRGKIRSLVVLPLKNLSGDPSQEYFVEGMHEALTTAVSKIGALRVISRTSAMRYKDSAKPLPEIAKELKVDAVVEGSVLEQGDRVRVTAQLIDATSDMHLWAESYDRSLRDVLAVDDEVARTIADKVKVALTPEEARRLSGAKRVDPDAYREYLKGNNTLLGTTPDSLQKAIQYYQAAIAIDPTYAPAYAGLADAYVNQGEWFGSLPRDEAYPKAKAAALRALELDDQLAHAHFALGDIQYGFDWDWPAAEASFRRGMELDPRFVPGRIGYTNYLCAMGRFEESIAVGKGTIEIDPLSAAAYNELTNTLWTAGRLDEAITYVRQAYELAPDDFYAVSSVGALLAWTGHAQDALPYLKRAEDLAGPKRLIRLAYDYAVAGQCADAQRLFERGDQRAREEAVWPTTSSFPRAHLCPPPRGLATKEGALAAIEKRYEDHDPELVFLKVEPYFTELRAEPRYQQLLRKMKLDR